MKSHFGGKKPYMADFEASDELMPDPFSEEPERHTAAHSNRRGQRIAPVRKNGKNKSKSENK